MRKGDDIPQIAEFHRQRSRASLARTAEGGCPYMDFAVTGALDKLAAGDYHCQFAGPRPEGDEIDCKSTIENPCSIVLNR